jgi:methylmalonyl-CoA mutase N-terminal domain/subunit
MDETLGLPTEQSVMIALRTQQIIAEESGVTNMIDPLGGSWAVEALTDRMEKDAFAYIDRIDEQGGIIRSINTGYPQKEIADSAYRFQQQLDAKEKIIVGVNKYQVAPEERPLELLKIEPEVERGQIERVTKIKKERNQAAVKEHLGRIHAAARNGTNLMPPLIDAVKEYCTLGEISDIYRDVFGVYRDPAWL